MDLGEIVLEREATIAGAAYSAEKVPARGKVVVNHVRAQEAPRSMLNGVYLAFLDDFVVTGTVCTPPPVQAGDYLAKRLNAIYGSLPGAGRIEA